MFTIIGGDGKEYGPASAEQLRAWIAAGRANLETQAKRAGTDAWHRLADFPEFAPEDSEPPVLADSAPVAVSTAAGVAGVASGPAPASRGVRLGAAFVDGFIEWLCWTPTRVAVSAFLSKQIQGGTLTPDTVVDVFHQALDVFAQAMIRSLPWLLLLAGVQAVLLTLRGQSIGKLLWRIRIVRVTDGAKPGFVRAFLLRGTVPLMLEKVPLLGALFWVVDAGMIFGAERRCVHDYIAGTKVVKA